MEAPCSSDVLLRSYQTIWRHIPEDRNTVLSPQGHLYIHVQITPFLVLSSGISLVFIANCVLGREVYLKLYFCIDFKSRDEIVMDDNVLVHSALRNEFNNNNNNNIMELIPS
jgi:hypothetical protein